MCAFLHASFQPASFAKRTPLERWFSDLLKPPTKLHVRGGFEKGAQLEVERGKAEI